MPIPFPQSGAHLLGQPFTLGPMAIPLYGTMVCNCAIAHGGAGAVLQVAGGPVTCPNCQKVYLVALPLPNGAQVQVAVSDPKVFEVPS